MHIKFGKLEGRALDIRVDDLAAALEAEPKAETMLDG